MVGLSWKDESIEGELEAAKEWPRWCSWSVRPSSSCDMVRYATDWSRALTNGCEAETGTGCALSQLNAGQLAQWFRAVWVTLTLIGVAYNQY